MKLAIVLVSLSLAVMGAMIYLAGTQEFKLRNLKTRILESSAEVKMKEKTIIELQLKIKTMKTELDSAITKTDALKKRKELSEKSAQDFAKILQTCTTETENVQKKKADTGVAIAKLKADQEVAKKNAEVDIQNLKKQILERDTAICAFADTTKEEARTLCGILEARK